MTLLVCVPDQDRLSRLVLLMSSDEFALPASGSTLRDAALAPSTLRAYNKHLSTFLRHVHLPLSQLVRLPPERIDELLAAWIDQSFAAKGSYDYACQALFGLVYRHPPLRLQLGESRLRLRGWKRLRSHHSHPPLTWELACLFATLLSKWGRHGEAVGTLLAFDCYLRVGELTRLQYCDVLLPNDPRAGSAHRGMALRLATTKTGANQWVAVRSPQVISALQSYLQAYPFLSDERIFGFTPAAFRTALHQAATAVGLGHIPYVPHSLRHGGATRDFLLGASIEQIMFHGRWVAMESARRYIQTSRALLMLQAIPAEVADLGALLAGHIEDVLRLLMDSVPLLRGARVVSAGRRRVQFRLGGQ